MIDAGMFNRSTKTADKTLAQQLARKWDHEALQTIAYDGERPVNLPSEVLSKAMTIPVVC
jgi:hypothetical protein